jgi:hypothetical protein
VSASRLSIVCDGGTGSQVIAGLRDNPFPDALYPTGVGGIIGTVGGLRSERWAASDWNRWAAYVGIRSVSLLAPNVRYPDHSHSPEEVYLVLSPGRFRHGESGWFEPGVGATLYNEPNILHAMSSEDVPLLAFWYLWTGAFA